MIDSDGGRRQPGKATRMTSFWTLAPGACIASFRTIPSLCQSVRTVWLQATQSAMQDDQRLPKEEGLSFWEAAKPPHRLGCVGAQAHKLSQKPPEAWIERAA
ncbi:hypothetical protein HYQ46_005685 [Verticillium longisporum]|nr:hypothetical protein HYQ46_005685 [Verticillium longisporum]